MNKHSAFARLPVYWLLLLFAPLLPLQAQSDTSASTRPNRQQLDRQRLPVTGVLQSAQGPVAGARILLKGSSYGAYANQAGRFSLLAPPGPAVLEVTAVGYQPLDTAITVRQDLPQLELTLQQDAIELNSVVVTGTRNETRRNQSPVVVEVLSRRVLEATQSVTLSEGLNFQPGLRVETNCQNCGFTAPRLNGLEGGYTQILINSRPIYSALAGIYGLELLPAAMIERVEVVRGSGSALYGAGAIGGALNIITKEPTTNGFTLANNTGLVAGVGQDLAVDNALSVTGSLVDENNYRYGLSLYGMNRRRDPWDANGDELSELVKLRNNAFGGRAYYRPGQRSRLELDFHLLKESRRGGNNFDRPPHEADVAEALEHDILGGGLLYELFSPSLQDKLTLYASGQRVDRSSYYGGAPSPGERYYALLRDPQGDLVLDSAGVPLVDSTDFVYGDPNAYGNTQDYSLVGGLQYARTFSGWGSGQNVLTTGAEYQFNHVRDAMPGYNRLIEQQVQNLGLYAQLEWRLHNRLTLLAGLRGDLYQLDNLSSQTDFDQFVVNPRLGLRTQLAPGLDLRLNYAMGFRGPQAFDEDLHITVVGGDAQLIFLSDTLEAERSHSLNANLEFTRNLQRWQLSLIANGFYTRLNNAFDQVTTQDGRRLNKVNRDGAEVAGASLELRAGLPGKLTLQAAATGQIARFLEPRAWFDDPEQNLTLTDDRILRTPNWYGYLLASWQPELNTTLNLSGVYTGSMPVPHVEGDITQPELVQTPHFFELNLRASYRFVLGGGLFLTLHAGVQNVLNSFQDDFDTGPNRDAAYIYGPARPRTYFAGFSLSSQP